MQKVSAGSSQITTVYRNKLLRFASESHRKIFLSSPESYWPQNDGICPVTAVDRNQLSAGQPAFAIRYQKKIHLCKDQVAAKTFLSSPQRYVNYKASPTQMSASRSHVFR